MFRVEIKAIIAGELARGAAARQQGLEGRARVCARRAAGAAVREYLDLRGLKPPGSSAYDLLVYLRDFADRSEDLSAEVSTEIRQVAGHFLAQVDEDFTLPSGIDLLAEAGWLSDALEASQAQTDGDRRGI